MSKRSATTQLSSDCEKRTATEFLSDTCTQSDKDKDEDLVLVTEVFEHNDYRFDPVYDNMPMVTYAIPSTYSESYNDVGDHLKLKLLFLDKNEVTYATCMFRGDRAEIKKLIDDGKATMCKTLCKHTYTAKVLPSGFVPHGTSVISIVNDLNSLIDETRTETGTPCKLADKHYTKISAGFPTIDKYTIAVQQFNNGVLHGVQKRFLHNILPTYINQYTQQKCPDAETHLQLVCDRFTEEFHCKNGVRTGSSCIWKLNEHDRSEVWMKGGLSPNMYKYVYAQQYFENDKRNGYTYYQLESSNLLELLAQSHENYCANIDKIYPTETKHKFKTRVVRKDHNVIGYELSRMESSLGDLKYTNIQFQNGEINGNVTETWTHGIIIGNVKNGVLDKEFRIYKSFGSCEIDMQFQNGVLQSATKKYLELELALIPPQNGQFEKYDKDSQLTATSYYESGSPVKHVVYNNAINMATVYTLKDDELVFEKTLPFEELQS